MHLLCVCALRCCFAEHFLFLLKNKSRVNGGVRDVVIRLTICFFVVFFVAELCWCVECGQNRAVRRCKCAAATKIGSHRMLRRVESYG